MRVNTEKSPQVGKHTFETLTTGMYSFPLDALREYVQNSVDSIEHAGLLKAGRIDVRVDPVARRLTVRDNGTGIPADSAIHTLQDVGRSRKHEAELRKRGFRGIGRFGGLAYCGELIFRTKAANENVCTSHIWNCDQLRDLLRPGNREQMTMSELISLVSRIEQEGVESSRPSFFEVEMTGVTEPLLLDISEVRSYLAAVAPLGFDHTRFTFGREIEQFLVREVPDYITVDLLVNDEQIFKPYSNTVPMSRAPGRKKDAVGDSIRDIDYLTLTDSNNAVLAHCWLAKTDLKGMVDPGSGIAGARVRVGNITLGGGSALEDCFPRSDKRFAAYLVGEVYAVAQNLIPNARRDSFEHNETRKQFISAAAKQIAEPYRRKIRDASNNRSSQKAVQAAQRVRQEAEDTVSRGVTTEDERETIASQIHDSIESVQGLGAGTQGVVEQLAGTAAAIEEAPRMVDVDLQKWRQVERDTFQGLFDILYEGATDKDWANRTIKKMISFLKQAKEERSRRQ